MEIPIIQKPEELYQKAATYLSDEEAKLMQHAYLFSEKHHINQKRLSGEPYIIHPLNVAFTLVWLNMDTPSILAALLHDVVEDTPVTSEELEAEFGSEVAGLVNGVTKISSLKDKSRELNQAVNIRKILMASFEDVRIIIIKLADKLHNMRTLDFQKEEKQKRISQEVLDIYAPLAGRLGMYQLKSELEDLAFKYLNPQMYGTITQFLAERSLERERFIQNIKNILIEKLATISIEASISGRAKHFFSIYAKMKRDGKELDQIYDMHGIRIITEKLKDCYGALGIVHTLWNPLPGRFKDYIAMPKANMYQSLHTTVWGPGMIPLEVQIRTFEMDRVAEGGIAAHWKYKETGKKQKFTWLEKMQKWHDLELSDSTDFLKSIKNDLRQQEIYAFTPKGQIIELPAGSTPLDFAYHIHSDIGNHCSGVRVNGKMVSLRYELKQGDQVEIITQKNTEPNVSWLKLCKTSNARSKIRSYLRKKEEHLLSQVAEKVAEKKEEQKKDNELPSVLQIKKVPYKEGTPRKKGNSVEVLGHRDLLVRFAQCCNPVIGDLIVGFITRGRGISVHRQDCPNVKKGDLENERMVDVIWESHGETYPVHITIIGTDRPYFLRDLVAEISGAKINILKADAAAGKKGDARLQFTIAISHAEELKNLIHALKQIRGVRGVERGRSGEKNAIS